MTVVAVLVSSSLSSAAAAAWLLFDFADEGRCDITSAAILAVTVIGIAATAVAAVVDALLFSSPSSVRPLFLLAAPTALEVAAAVAVVAALMSCPLFLLLLRRDADAVDMSNQRANE